jgi:hypothetical protein
VKVGPELEKGSVGLEPIVAIVAFVLDGVDSWDLNVEFAQKIAVLEDAGWVGHDEGGKLVFWADWM